MLHSRALLLVLVGVLITGAYPIRAQTSDIEATEERLQALKGQIGAAEERLAEKARQEQASLETLEALNRKIAVRQELVQSYQQRLGQLKQREAALRASLSALATKAEQLKESYRRRAVHAYTYGRLHDVALILAAESINQMLMRAFYLHKFAQQRRRQLDSLRATRAMIREQRQALDAKRARTAELLRDARSERENLAQLQSSRRDVIEELRAESAAIEEEMATKRAAARRLEAKIRRLVSAARARRERERRSVPPPVRAADRARFEAVTGSFEENRGGLPWPAQGAIAEDFGMTVNPVHGTRTPNPGVMIATNPQAPVRAVFEGEVVSVDAMPGYGTLVAVRHGEYLTLYANLSALYVGEGDRVAAGEVIGRAGTEAQPRGAGLFFALFKNGEAVDPERWLRDR